MNNSDKKFTWTKCHVCNTLFNKGYGKETLDHKIVCCAECKRANDLMENPKLLID